MTEILPPSSGLAFGKDARDLLIECCVEFITLISSEANEISEKEAKKTIACEHITKALEQLGFSEYVADILEVANEHKEQLKVSAESYRWRVRGLTVSRDGKRRRINLSRAASRLNSCSRCRRLHSKRLPRDTARRKFVDILCIRGRRCWDSGNGRGKRRGHGYRQAFYGRVDVWSSSQQCYRPFLVALV